MSLALIIAVLLSGVTSEPQDSVTSQVGMDSLVALNREAVLHSDEGVRVAEAAAQQDSAAYAPVDTYGFGARTRQVTGGYMLAPPITYFILAPKKVHPNQVFQMSVSLLEMWLHSQIDVRAIVKRDNEEVVSETYSFYRPGTNMMQLKIPPSAEYGNYTLRVEGQPKGGIGGYLFWNETEIMFHKKQVAVFIQLAKPLYHQDQKVLFRVMPVEQNLMSRSGSLDVYITDATGTTVQRWKSMQTNAGGALDMEFMISDQPAYGQWKVKVDAFGEWYEKSFEVNEFWVTAIDVNVSMPVFHYADDWGIAGVISANLSLGQPVKGTCKVKAEVRLPLKQRDPNVDYQWPTIEKEFPGVTDFFFTMDELRNVAGEMGIKNREVYVEALAHDWFLVQNATGSSVTVVYANDVQLHLLGDPIRTFKPNATITIYFACAHPDGGPLRRDRRQVTLQRTTRTVSGQTRSEDNVKFMVSDDGIARYSFQADWDALEINVFAYYDVLESNKAQARYWRHFSPTNTYLSVTTSTEQPLVDEYMVFTVTSSMQVPEINYLITAGGNVLTGNRLEMHSRQKTLALALSRDMIPEAHIIVWFFFKEEVVSDSLNFFVNGTRLNTMDVTLNRGKDFTGDTMEANAFADPSSYIGFQGIDYELWAYGWQPFITEVEMVKELQTFEPHVNRSYQWIWKRAHEQEEMVHFPAPTYAVDANQTFDYAGLLVFTDGNVTRIHHPCNETLGEHPCMDGTCYHWSQRCDGTLRCQDGQDEMGCEYWQERKDPFTAPKDRLGLVTRHYNEMGYWLWGGHFLQPNGRVDLYTQVPDEPMAWVVSAFGISKDRGFGIINNPMRYQATRSFYMRVEAPEWTVKGEQIGVRIGLFNYWNQDIECMLTLHASPKYRFVVVEDYGIVRSYDPRTLSGTIQTMVFLRKGMAYELQMPILPTIDPEFEECFTVTLTAYSHIYGDSDSAEVCLKYDGVTNHLNTPYFIDLVNSGSQVLPDLEIPVPERFIKPNERQHLYVPGSPVATVGMVGDVVGPGFFEEHLNAENTLRKPYGGAEHSIYNFATNLLYIKYLKATNQLRWDTLTRTLNHLNLDLQRTLGYLNATDYSVSMFRDYQQPTPSVWTTSTVLRFLNEADEKDWDAVFFIEIDLLNKMALWLCDQQTGDGLFEEKSPFYDRKITGNRTNAGPGKTKPKVIVTAHVLITLAEANRLTGQAEICRNSAINSAVRILELMLGNITDVYELSIVTYALHVAGSNQNTHAFNLLQARRRTGNLVYWANKEVPANDIIQRDTIEYYQPRRWWDNEGYAVESTGYGLLTYLRRNLLDDSVPIMKWLNTMRNTYGGMASTQDSIIALKALTEYAKLDTNRALYNMEILVLATSMGNFSTRVRLNRTNWQDQQHVRVHPVWGSVRGRALGTGMALMQLSTKVNVEYSRMIRPVAEQRWFDVSLPEILFQGRNFSIMTTTACARWVRPDISNTSGMAVLEVHVPSGYKITNDVLRSYAQSGDVPTLRRAFMNEKERKVSFYFDYLDSRHATCVKFRTDRWFPVANMTIQHIIRVFDYYEPGMHNTTLFDTYQLFNLHICQVCGSYQCPYCRYYNQGNNLSMSMSVSCFIVVLGLIIVKTLFRTTSTSEQSRLT